MAVLVIADVPGQTRELYDSMLAALGGVMGDAAPRQPVLRDVRPPEPPEGIKPRRSFQELDSLVTGFSSRTT